MRKVTPIILLLVLSGCASVIKGTKQGVNVSTNVTEPANCIITDKKNRAYTVTAPGRVELSRGDGPLNVRCDTSNGEGQKVVDEEVEGWTFGNLFMPFIWPLAFGYDAYSGAYQRYPDDINVGILTALPAQGGTQ